MGQSHSCGFSTGVSGCVVGEGLEKKVDGEWEREGEDKRAGSGR